MLSSIEGHLPCKVTFNKKLFFIEGRVHDSLFCDGGTREGGIRSGKGGNAVSYHHTNRMVYYCVFYGYLNKPSVLKYIFNMA